MGKITLNRETVETLDRAGGYAELCDQTGRPVGYFIPPAAHEVVRKAFLDWAFSQVTEDECRRALANPKRHTMAEVLKLVEGE